MTVSAIIPAYNEEKYIEACVDSIFAHCMDGFFTEVIVVNNGSTDATGEILEKLQSRHGSRLIVIHEPTNGVSFARKHGLEIATGEYIASIDADCRPDERWCSMAKKLLSEHSDAVCISGPYSFYDATPFLRILLAARRWITRLQLMLERHQRTHVYGGNFIARRSTLIAAGGFNTNIRFWGDDVDVEIRIKRFGNIVHDTTFMMPSSARRFLKGGIVRTWVAYKLMRFFPIYLKKNLPLKEEIWR